MTRKEIMELWRICFNDPEEFIRFYFDRKYKEENTLFIREKGKIVSALQILPYTMTWQGKEIPVSYISGASTHPEARNRGLMGKLLTEAFIVMRNRKILFSLLIPQENWLYEYYARFGYAAVLACTPENYYLPVNYIHKNVQIYTPSDPSFPLEELYAYFNREMHQRPNCVQHTYEDFISILEDLSMSGGRLLLYSPAEGELKGMAFALDLPEKVRITELLYQGEEEKSALLSTAAAIWGKNEIECKTPPRSGHSIRRGMIRLIDARQALEIYAATHPRKSLLLHLTDSLLPSNTGYYRLKNGQCFPTGSGVQLPDLKVNNEELTQILFAQPAFISLMLD